MPDLRGRGEFVFGSLCRACPDTLHCSNDLSNSPRGYILVSSLHFYNFDQRFGRCLTLHEHIRHVYDIIHSDIMILTFLIGCEYLFFNIKFIESCDECKLTFIKWK